MIEHPPVEMICKPDVLMKLQSGIRAFASDRFSEVSDAETVFFLMEDGQYLRLSCQPIDLAWKFEVFSMRLEWHSDYVEEIRKFRESPRCKELRKAEQALFDTAHIVFTESDATALPEEFSEWPFAEWQVEVLRRREGVCELSGEWVHAADVAVGLLFGDVRGRQFLIVGDDWPLGLVLSWDDERISGLLTRCDRIPLAEYALRYLGG